MIFDREEHCNTLFFLVYLIADTGITAGDTSACISGYTLDSRPFGGCNPIQTVPPSR